FVAIPAGPASGVQGTYQAGFIDFLQGSASQVRDGYFTLTSNGSGSFGNVQVNGALANHGSSNQTQTYNNVTYSFSNSNGIGAITFPNSPSPASTLLSGAKTLYISAD